MLCEIKSEGAAVLGFEMLLPLKKLCPSISMFSCVHLGRSNVTRKYLEGYMYYHKAGQELQLTVQYTFST